MRAQSDQSNYTWGLMRSSVESHLSRPNQPASRGAIIRKNKVPTRPNRILIRQFWETWRTLEKNASGSTTSLGSGASYRAIEAGYVFYPEVVP